jgi:uncharacterized protein YkwD
MTSIFLSLILLFSTAIAPVNTTTVNEKWDKETLKQANTAADADYLNEEEKNIIFYSNLARMNGPLFAETYLNDFLKKNNTKQTRYVTSLIKDLKNTSGLEPMLPQKDLSDIAKGHAVVSGKKGTMGHQNFENRVKPVFKKYIGIGENCHYGYTDGLSIVMDLLIDEGIANLGHRKNILKPDFTNVGVSIQPHKTYRVNSVMIFGGKIQKEI